MHSRSPAGPLLMEHDGVLCGHLKSVMAVDMYEALSMQQAFVPTADLHNNHRSWSMECHFLLDLHCGCCIGRRCLADYEEIADPQLPSFASLPGR
jgi:hypothetical protein